MSVLSWSEGSGSDSTPAVCCFILSEREPDECAKQYPKVFSSFAVTRSKHKSEQSDQVQPSQKLFSQVDESSWGKKQFVSYPVTIAV